MVTDAVPPGVKKKGSDLLLLSERPPFRLFVLVKWFKSGLSLFLDGLISWFNAEDEAKDYVMLSHGNHVLRDSFGKQDFTMHTS